MSKCRHARHANPVLDDPEELGIVPMLSDTGQFGGGRVENLTQGRIGESRTGMADTAFADSKAMSEAKIAMLASIILHQRKLVSAWLGIILVATRILVSGTLPGRSDLGATSCDRGVWRSVFIIATGGLITGSFASLMIQHMPLRPRRSFGRIAIAMPIKPYISISVFHIVEQQHIRLRQSIGASSLTQ